MLLDPGSQIHLFRSKCLLKNIRRTPLVVKVIGIAKDPLVINQIADHPTFGVVYYSEHSSANILALSVLEETFSVDQVKKKDITCGYVACHRVTGEALHFNCRSGLFVYSDSRLPREASSYINTVSFRKTKYTKRQVEKADMAHLIRERMGWPSTATIKKIINTGGILNMPITSKDIDTDLDIYGRSYADAAGKFTYKPTPTTPEEDVCDEVSALVENIKKIDMTLYCDLIFIGGLAFLVSVSRPLDYVIVSYVKTKGWLDILNGVQEHKNTYIGHGFSSIKTIRFDNEKGVECIRQLLLEKLQLRLDTSAPYQHVPIVEAKNRRIKERVRCLIAHLPYKLNVNFLMYLPRYVARRLNICPSSHNGITVSPFEILTGVKVDFKKELKIGFGEAAHVYSRTDARTNLVTVERVKKLAICLGFSNNKECSAIFYDPGKRVKQRPSIVVADNFTPVPLSDIVIMQLNNIAEGGPDTSHDLEDDHEDDDGNIASDHQETPPDIPLILTNLDDLPPPDPSAFIDSNVDAEKDPAVNISTPLVLPDNYMDALEDEVDLSSHPDDDDGDAMTPPQPEESLRGEHHQGIDPNNENNFNNSRYHTRSRSGTSRKHDDQTYFYHKVVSHISMQAGIKRHQQTALDSISKEIKAVEDKSTFKPLNFKELTYKQKRAAIRSFMFMKEKYDAAGKFIKLKSRLTANGKQQDRVFIENSFGSVSSPTLAMSSLMMMLAIAKSQGRHLATIDIGSAYLNADMSNEDVIMILDKVVAEQYIKTKPEYSKFLNEKGEMYVKLEKALYGSLQASKLWYQNISSFLLKCGYIMNDSDPCVFNKWIGKECISIGIYVDDLIITATDKGLIKDLKKSLIAQYTDINYDDGNMITYLGMMINNSNRKYIDLTMPQFIEDIISDMNISKKDLSKTPASSKLFNIKPNDPLLGIDEKDNFHTNVAKLLYLGKRARPDILLAATFLCTRVKSPGADDLKKLKRCIRYLNATKDKSYRINASEDIFDMCVYIDASFAVHENMRSHSGAILSLGNGVVVYCESFKQKLNAKSSTEAELIAVSDVLPQVIACRNFLSQQLREEIIINLYQDNKSTMALIKNGRPLAKSTRHINIRFFFISDYQSRGEIKVKHLASERMVADYYTKPLQGSLFSDHCDFIMGHKVHKEANMLCCTIQRLIDSSTS